MKTYSIGGLMIMAACVCASCAYTKIPEDEKLSNQEQSENYREISFSPFFLEVTEDSILAVYPNGRLPAGQVLVPRHCLNLPLPSPTGIIWTIS
jgi:hypothetical protein